MAGHSGTKLKCNKPAPFVIDKKSDKEKIRQDWLIWKKEFEVYLKLSGKFQKFTGEDKALLLQNLMGKTAIKIMQHIHFDSEAEMSNVDILLKKFDEIFNLPLYESKFRYNFFSSKVSKNETIDEFLQTLKQKAKICNFGDDEEKFIMDLIIFNAKDSLREMIFHFNFMNLRDLLTFCKLNGYNEPEELQNNADNNEESSNCSQRLENNALKQSCCFYQAMNGLETESSHFSVSCCQYRRKIQENYQKEGSNSSKKVGVQDGVKSCRFGNNCTIKNCKLVHDKWKPRVAARKTHSSVSSVNTNDDSSSSDNTELPGPSGKSGPSSSKIFHNSSVMPPLTSNTNTSNVVKNKTSRNVLLRNLEQMNAISTDKNKSDREPIFTNSIKSGVKGNWREK